MRPGKWIEKRQQICICRGQKFHISLQHEYRCFVKYPLITWNRKFLKLSRWFSLIQMPKLVMFNVSSVQTVSIRLTRDYREHLTVNKFSFCTSSLKRFNSVSLSKLCFLTFTTERNMQIGTACTKNNRHCQWTGNKRTFLLNLKCGLAMFKRCSIWYWFVYYIPKPPLTKIYLKENVNTDLPFTFAV